MLSQNSSMTVMAILFVGASIAIMSYYNNIRDPEETRMRVLFSDWKEKFNKTYAGQSEDDDRFTKFCYNYKKILDHNLNHNASYTLGLNVYADMTPEEFHRRDTIRVSSLERMREIPAVSLLAEKKSNLLKQGASRWDSKYLNTLVDSDLRAKIKASLPQTIDWRTKNVVTSVKDQGPCGACWAFGAVGSLEGGHAIKTGQNVDLSIQQLIECSTNQPNRGCDGGDLVAAMHYVINVGVQTAVQYPFVGDSPNRCQIRNYSAANFAYSPKNFTRVPANDSLELMAAVAQQPISACIDVSDEMYLYDSGIFNENCGINIDHCVTIVGYGEENGVEYWIVKNSWGSDWGEKGYFKILKSGTTGPGECGIRMESAYPNLDS
jgi:hypothetical protein